MSDWQLIDTAPDGVLVETKIHDERGERNHQQMKRQGGLWWINGRGIYAYYVPTHWKHISGDSTEAGA